MTMRLVTKDPDSIEPQGLDWTSYLAGLSDADTITTSTWAVSGNDETLLTDDDSIVAGSRQTQVLLSGGTVGLRYVVTNHIVTSSGVEDDWSFTVLIAQK